MRHERAWHVGGLGRRGCVSRCLWRDMSSSQRVAPTNAPADNPSRLLPTSCCAVSAIELAFPANVAHASGAQPVYRETPVFATHAWQGGARKRPDLPPRSLSHGRSGGRASGGTHSLPRGSQLSPAGRGGISSCDRDDWCERRWLGTVWGRRVACKTCARNWFSFGGQSVQQWRSCLSLPHRPYPVLQLATQMDHSIHSGVPLPWPGRRLWSVLFCGNAGLDWVGAATVCSPCGVADSCEQVDRAGVLPQLRCPTGDVAPLVSGLPSHAAHGGAFCRSSQKGVRHCVGCFPTAQTSAHRTAAQPPKASGPWRTVMGRACARRSAIAMANRRPIERNSWRSSMRPPS